MLTVTKNGILPVPQPLAWRFVTEPKLLSQWFADVEELEPGKPFRFDFGDGDFFAGSVLEWEAPRLLTLRWKFMGVGPEFRIRYTLRPVPEGTSITVEDTGSLTPQEAQGLEEGWGDFLARLSGRVISGRCTRYRWSQTIGTAASLGNGTSSAFAFLNSAEKLAAAFPEASTESTSDAPGKLRLRFNDSAWDDIETEAEITISQFGPQTYVGVVHTGWERLPPAVRVSERKRYAEQWARFLSAMEQGPIQAIP